MEQALEEAPQPLGSWISPGMRYMVAGAFFFSIMTLGVKLAGERIPSQQIVLVRGILTTVFSYLLLRHAGVYIWGTRPMVLVLRGLLGFGALSCLYYAVVRLPLADATLIQYTNPVWTALFAGWVLGERLRFREALLVLASLVGVVLIARPSFLFGAEAARLDLVAVTVALIGSIFSASAYVTVRKLGRTEHPLVIVFYFTLVTIPASLPGVVGAVVWPDAREWMLLMGIAVTAQAGQIYLTRGLQLEPAGRATATGYMQVVFAVIWGALVFQEYPDLWMGAGAMVILTSTLVLVRSQPGPPSRVRVVEESAAEIPIELGKAR